MCLQGYGPSAIVSGLGHTLWMFPPLPPLHAISSAAFFEFVGASVAVGYGDPLQPGGRPSPPSTWFCVAEAPTCADGCESGILPRDVVVIVLLVQRSIVFAGGASSTAPSPTFVVPVCVGLDAAHACSGCVACVVGSTSTQQHMRRFSVLVFMFVASDTFLVFCLSRRVLSLGGGRIMRGCQYQDGVVCRACLRGWHSLRCVSAPGVEQAHSTLALALSRMISTSAVLYW